MPETPYAWLGDVQTFLGTAEEDLLRDLTRFARETGAPQLFAWDRSLAALRHELATCLPEAAGFALVLGVAPSGSPPRGEAVISEIRGASGSTPTESSSRADATVSSSSCPLLRRPEWMSLSRLSARRGFEMLE